MHGIFPRQITFGFCVLFLSLAASASEPVPLLNFDFSKTSGGRVLDSAASGLTLNLGKAAVLKDGALVFNGSRDSFAAADADAFKRWAGQIDLREISCAFWVRFDRATRAVRDAAPSLGLFHCALNAENKLEIHLLAAPTEIMTDRLVLRSRDKIKPGAWHHVEFNFSANRRRYSLYLDGKWQMENDSLTLPALALGPFKMGSGFQGAIKDLKFYDAALDSETLAIASQTAADYDAMAGAARALAGSVKNTTLRAWANALAKRAAALKADMGKTTIAQARALARDIRNAQTLALGIEDAAATIADQPVTVYAVPPASQALFLPYDLPEVGRLSNKIELFAAQGEFESASIVVVPFKAIKNFTIKLGDLKGKAGTLPATNVDLKLVKRWYRTGGAWMTYHADKRQRVLVPDLLLNDENIVRVDENRASNELLLHFPRGDQYVDVSRYAYDQTYLDTANDPFYDAPSLQPVALPEAGRNQQYLLTFHVPETAAPGFYDGTLELLADGQAAGKVAVSLRVLPFVLPEPKTYYDITRPYYSHINSAPSDQPWLFSSALANLKNHSLLHASRVSDTAWQIEEAKKIGYPLNELVSAAKPGPRAWLANFGGPPELITTNDQAVLDRIFLRGLKKQTDFYEKHIGSNVVFYHVAASEASSYRALVLALERGSDLYHEFSSGRIMTHGMRDALYMFTSDFNDMDSATNIRKDWAEIWHAAGGRIMNYCNPFPGAENPAWFRRKIGLLMYKAHYDGQMLHGYFARFWNEFAEWPGGDGNYRNFGMVYPQRNGFINTLALLGAREAYDDVRYATKLRQLALEHRDSADVRLAREAKRQLVWLERLDGEKADGDAFRTGAAHRILTLLELIRVRGGKS